VHQHQKVGLDNNDMLWVDNEVADGHTPGQVSACAAAFMNRLHQLRPNNPIGVYTGLNFAINGYDSGLGKWPLWLAAYQPSAPHAPPTWAKWTFWQWGFRQGIDADAFNGTKTNLTAWLNTFRKDPPPPSKGPFKHVFPGGKSWHDIAAERNTTALHLWQESMGAYTPDDHQALRNASMEQGVPFYTTNP
jgi:hypothetical protein